MVSMELIVNIPQEMLQSNQVKHIPEDYISDKPRHHCLSAACFKLKFRGLL